MKIDYIEFMYRAYGYIRDNGYVKNETAKEILDRIDDPVLKRMGGTDQDIDNFILWCDTQTKQSDYMTTVKAINDVAKLTGEIDTKYLNVPCSALNLYFKKMREEEERKNSTSTFIGDIKDKITVEIKDIRRLYTNSFGYYIYRVVGTDDNIYIISTTIYNLNSGDVITGTIKDHREYKGEKQTVLNRIKKLTTDDDEVTEMLQRVANDC